MPRPRRRLWFTDEAEYYAVCADCYAAFAGEQWTGSTRGSTNWRARAERYLAEHEAIDGACEFCSPEIGNGGPVRV